MLTRPPLSLIVELDVPWSTKCSVTSALMNSGGGLSDGMLADQRDLAGRVPAG